MSDTEIIDWLDANPEAISVVAVRKSHFGRKIWWSGPWGDYDTLRDAVEATVKQEKIRQQDRVATT